MKDKEDNNSYCCYSCLISFFGGFFLLKLFQKNWTETKLKEYLSVMSRWYQLFTNVKLNVILKR